MITRRQFDWFGRMKEILSFRLQRQLSVNNDGKSSGHHGVEGMFSRLTNQKAALPLCLIVVPESAVGRRIRPVKRNPIVNFLNDGY